MKAQRPIGLTLSWPRLTAVFVIDVALLVAASHWPGTRQAADYAWWTGVGLAVLVAIVALVTYRQVPLGSAVVAAVRTRFVDSDEALTGGRPAAVDHQRRFGRDVVGIREHDGRLVAVIAVADNAPAPPGRHHREAAPVLPVAKVAAGLRQFDVRLDSIDIVSVATPPDGTDTEADATTEHLQRDTWLVLRMDPQRNAAAVAVRDSVAATFAAVTERLAREIDGRYLTARPLTAEEFGGMDAAVLAGLQPAQLRRGRRHHKDKHSGATIGYATSFWVSPRDITSDTLDRLWLPDAEAVVVTVRLRSHRGRTQASVVVRYHSSDRLTKDQRAGLNRLTGRQLAAVLACLAVPARHAPLVVPARELADDEQLAVPVGHAAAGQLAAQP